jgi:formylglycine-generating enzyme required for sulfatase activity
MRDCGANAEDCCASFEVSGGTFYRTYTNDGSGATAKADPATVSTYRLDEYLVTVARFRRFAQAWHEGWRPPSGSGKHTHLNDGAGLQTGAGVAYEPGWVASDDGEVDIVLTDQNLACGPEATWTPSPTSHDNLPITCVNWWEAYAFCIWDGGFLPSEAEWEYAAAGGNQQREYPWGATPPGTSNQYAIYGCSFNGGGAPCPSGAIAPVGTASRGGGLWGQLDLAGELWEWVLDWHATYVDPCVDCAYLAISTANRVLRGGAFFDDVSTLLPTTRYSVAPNNFANIGIRCARSP